MRRMVVGLAGAVALLSAGLTAVPAVADPGAIVLWSDPRTTLYGPSAQLIVGLDEEPCCGQTVLWEWDLDDDGAYDDACPSPQSLLWDPADYAEEPGDYTVHVRATAGESVFTKDIVIPVGPYVPPPAFSVSLATFGQYVVGQPGSLFLTIEGQPQDTELTLAWDLDNDGAFDDQLSGVNTFVPTVAGSYPVRVSARHSGMDTSAPSITASAQVTVAAAAQGSPPAARLVTPARTAGAANRSAAALEPVVLTAVGTTGIARVGQVLTSTGGVAEPADAVRTVAWLREGSAIGGANGATYQLTQGDAGRRVAVRIDATRTACAPGTRTSSARAVAALNLTRPSFTGTARVGRRLTGTRGSWSQWNHTFSYRWLRDGRAISGATRTTYVTTRADRRHLITFQVTAKRSGFPTVTARSVSRRIY